MLNVNIYVYNDLVKCLMINLFEMPEPFCFQIYLKKFLQLECFYLDCLIKKIISMAKLAT